MSEPILVVARLSSPLAGEAPHLDALMEYLLSLYHRKGVPGYKVDRQFPAPPQAEIPVPVRRRLLAGHDGRPWQVAACSSPVPGPVLAETVEHVNKRIDVDEAALLAPRCRQVVTTTNSWTKSYRLPLRVRRVGAVAWFADGDRREVLKLVRRAGAVGKKIADGYGRVAEWRVGRADSDVSWFAPSPSGPVLMRPLPAGPHLPPGLIGARRDFGACVPPYWHQDRYTEVVVPC